MAAGMNRGGPLGQPAGAGGSGQPLGSRDLWPAPHLYPRVRSGARYASRHWRLCASVLLGAAGAAAVGYLTAQNAHARPAHVAVVLRVVIIVTLIAVGFYAQIRTSHTRLGVTLVGVGLFASVWLLNGSREPLLFSLGVLLGGLAPPVFAYLVLAYPSGRVR